MRNEGIFPNVSRKERKVKRIPTIENINESIPTKSNMKPIMEINVDLFI